jgi:hypothetical protein
VWVAREDCRRPAPSPPLHLLHGSPALFDPWFFAALWPLAEEDLAPQPGDFRVSVGAGLVCCLWFCDELSFSVALSLPGYDVYVPPQRYASLLAAATNAIKSSNPAAVVVMGGLASGSPPYVTDVISSANGKLPCDAVAVHPYGRRPSQDWPSPTWGFGVLGDLMSAYEAVATAPLWITEVWGIAW